MINDKIARELFDDKLKNEVNKKKDFSGNYHEEYLNQHFDTFKKGIELSTEYNKKLSEFWKLTEFKKESKR